MTYEERLQLAKTTDNMEVLLDLAKKTTYNDLKMLMAVANNSNANAQVRHFLLESRARFYEIHEVVCRGLLNLDDLKDVVRIVENNVYDWFEEEWEPVKEALITGENVEQLRKEESLSFIFEFKFPGYDKYYKYWYIPY